MSLKQIKLLCAVQVEWAGGVRTVPISQIRGSEGRSGYFDRDFNPLYDRARGRWLGIARARQQGKDLPPVVLVQVGDIYFVRDGHHRISVARAMGQMDVEARVTIWQMAAAVPWEALEQPLYLRRAANRLVDECSRMRARVVQVVRAFRAKE